MKSQKIIKYMFVSCGPGETGQARALAKFISGKKGKILFVVEQAVNLSFLSNDKEFEVFVANNLKKLKEIVEMEKPDILLIFNSKMWGRNLKFSARMPFNFKHLVFCVDSNWLFNEAIYPYYIKWADKYLILFPEKIYRLGIKENGGYFTIPKEWSEKIIPVGFIPSYAKPKPKNVADIRRKYNISANEKFIFSYFSGLGAAHRTFAFDNLISAVNGLIKEGRKIKVLYVGPIEDLKRKQLKRSWLMTKKELPGDEYFLTLASSDLVFQHQGMVTLAQAISAQVPAICNIHFTKKEIIPRIHLWEVSPFERANVCEMFYKTSAPGEIKGSIKRLLYNKKAINKMKRIQRLVFQNGEKDAFDIINKSLKRDGQDRI